MLELQHALPPKASFVCAAYRALMLPVSGLLALFSFKWVRTSWSRIALCDRQGPRAETFGAMPGAESRHVPRCGPGSGHPPRQPRACEDMRITIPIPKPPSWREVQQLVEGRAVTFDERGWKETMTVRASRWGAFVDRQKQALERELGEMRRAAERKPALPIFAPETGQCDFQVWDQKDSVLGGQSSVGSSSSSTSGAEFHEDDVADLEHMVERMQDWKDLAQFSGKNISMASTQRGNEMKIHVLAFADKEDGSGVDFMRVSYKKTVEVRRRRGSAAAEARCGLSVGRWFARRRPEDDGDFEQWVHLLRRPDVAKFTIALAFREALARDGVYLQICDGPIDNFGDL